MQANKMVPDKLYRLESGKVITFHHMTSKGSYAIVSEYGESDTQSSWGISFDEEVMEVPKVTYSGRCPNCDREVLASPRRHPNHIVACHNAHCHCGWMGDYEYKASY